MWFEISKILIAVLKHKFIMLFKNNFWHTFVSYSVMVTARVISVRVRGLRLVFGVRVRSFRTELMLGSESRVS